MGFKDIPGLKTKPQFLETESAAIMQTDQKDRMAMRAKAGKSYLEKS